jgi:hypothetical protein
MFDNGHSHQDNSRFIADFIDAVRIGVVVVITEGDDRPIDVFSEAMRS